MITIDQVKEYLATINATVPDFILNAWIARLDAVEECLTEHYDAPTALLIEAYLLGLFAYAGGDAYISSQTAPSGASRSFRYGSFADRWRSLGSLLASLDTFGCTADLIPADPTGAVAHGGIWVANGGCCT